MDGETVQIKKATEDIMEYFELFRADAEKFQVFLVLNLRGLYRNGFITGMQELGKMLERE